MTIKDLQAYELIKEEMLDDIRSKGYLLRHRKSGARVLYIENEDDNKVFHITFRTPPTDNTGVAHILEHCSLCGSEKFPSKDPFVELVKGSLNTFLNAMTYPDKTMYPVASCNDKDFANLMHVYLDAVFKTNIYQKEEIFRQEGWNYQIEKPEDAITYNGVVYNEMKGAYSSPEDVLEREILNALYPDTPYGFESGGDPKCIPDLKYEDFLAFHSRYYHPSNAYIYLYGKMDIGERLQWIDQEYLSQYDRKETDSALPMQKPFEKMHEVYRKYSISTSESEKDNTYLSWNVSVGSSLDVKLVTAFSILEYALLSAPGAPLKQALIDAGIGKDILGSFESGILQPSFSVIAKNANPEDKEKFLCIIRQTLTDSVKNGLDEKALLAGINSSEFRFREADYGSYPKGLMYGIDIMDSWLYDENEPFAYVRQLDIYDELKKAVGSGYYEELIQKYLLDNPHAAMVVIEPKKGLTAETEEAVAAKLAEFKAGLSEEQIQELIEKTQKLQKFQQTPSVREELEKIPMLTRDDIKKECRPFSNEVRSYGEVPVLWHEILTNGIAYLTLYFDLEGIGKEDLPYVGLLKNVLGMIDTGNYAYGELFNEINVQSGGIGTGITAFPDKEGKKLRTMFTVSARTLYNKMDFVFEMIEEILFSSKLEDEKRLKEILAEQKSRTQMRISTAGHSAAATRAMAYFSESAAFCDLTGGIAYYDLLNKLDRDFEEQKETLKAKLKELMTKIFRQSAITVSVTAEKSGMDGLEEKVKHLYEKLSKKETESAGETLAYGKQNEGFQTSAKIQYVTRAGNYRMAGYEYTGVLRILKVIMSYGYLWEKVRVEGGAYGCMSGFGRNGNSYFASYRDPNLRRTDEVYEGIPEYVEHFEAEDRDMTKYIIGTVSELDAPLTARAQGARSDAAYFGEVTEEVLQKERDQILNATQEDIRALAPLMHAILEGNYFCVLGNEDALENEKELFLNLRPLG